MGRWSISGLENQPLSHHTTNDMKRILKKFGKLKPKPQDSYLTFTGTNERTITGTADPMPSVLAHAATQASSATAVSVKLGPLDGNIGIITQFSLSIRCPRFKFLLLSRSPQASSILCHPLPVLRLQPLKSFKPRALL